ncbi:unnamed protein product [Miscanthus lutarioriparius]|uniref:Filament-like plant protein 7 n=1 Tax=Miscanthus lutarioriparius TaxID=422564 RepID=A0A811MCL3_9POAL|nr:unnamed protein product [Miscanthus lutarioriparius]
MDRRSWPWKKKSSDKSSDKDGLQRPNQAEDEEVPKYMQISPGRYSHLTASQEQVEILSAKIKILNDKISAAQCEMNTKDAIVKQHAKVAEEAISGWEQAEPEASALKLQLEIVTLSKLAAEERATHLDGALKECMKQVRAVKEEGEQKLLDVVLAKTKHFEKIRAELEAKLVDFEQKLIRAGSENDALSRSLGERENLLMKVHEEKAQAETQIEVLKSTIQSGEKEVNSLKYELHVVSKELDIRNEKNMSVRSADVAIKQHMEDVKKISKLEVECQRLRGLVRKKLPGPAALAQMKMEMDSWSRDPGEPAFVFKEFYIPETKKLKGALSKCNQELQASKNMCAKTSSKLHSMELHVLSANLCKSPTNSSIDTSASSRKGSNPPSLTSMSEDGADNATSCEEAWANTLESKLSHIKKDKGAQECGVIVDKNVGKVELTESNKISSPPLQSPGSSFSSDLIDKALFLKLHLRISALLKSQSPQNDVKVLDGIRNILRDIEEEAESVNRNKIQHDDMVEVAGSGSSAEEVKPLGTMDQRLTKAIFKIHEFA